MMKFQFKFKQGGFPNTCELVDSCLLLVKDLIYDIQCKTTELYSYDNLMVRMMQKEIDREILKEMIALANAGVIVHHTPTVTITKQGE